MAKVTVRHSRLSRYSSIGMILLGVFTFPFDGFFGLVLIVLGVVMYWIYRRQSGPQTGGRRRDSSASP